MFVKTSNDLSFSLMSQNLLRSCKIKAVVLSFPFLRASRRQVTTMTAKPPLDPSQPIHWILDWDGTITRRDTLDALVSIAATSKPTSPVFDEWKRVSEAYMVDYTTAMEKLAPGGDLPKTVQKERILLRALASVEQASLDRVPLSGIFAGLTRKLLDEGARRVIDSRKVELRKGFTHFVQHMQSRNCDDLDLLSVNWSRHFISSCLKAGGASVDPQAIYANELDGIERDLVSTGKISPDDDAEMKIISSGDKLEYLRRLRKLSRISRDKKSDSSKPVVYVGDSWTDIECLLEADLGISIRDDPQGSSQKKLADRLQSLGIHCPRLQDWKSADEWQVVWARDFAEVRTWIEAHHESIPGT
jgi:thiamine phosphate phosphatase / amino-HMP aminohydrolase